MQQCHSGRAAPHPSLELWQEPALNLPNPNFGSPGSAPHPLQGFGGPDSACHPSLHAVTDTHWGHCASRPLPVPTLRFHVLIVSKLSAHSRRCPSAEVPGRPGWGGGRGRGRRLPPAPGTGRAGRKGQRAQPWEGERCRAPELLPPCQELRGCWGRALCHLPPRHSRAVPSSAAGGTGDLLQPPAVPSLGTSPHPSPTRTFLSLLFLH